MTTIKYRTPIIFGAVSMVGAVVSIGGSIELIISVFHRSEKRDRYLGYVIGGVVLSCISGSICIWKTSSIYNKQS